MATRRPKNANAAKKEGTLRTDLVTGDLVMVLATTTWPFPAVPESLTAVFNRDT